MKRQLLPLLLCLTPMGAQAETTLTVVGHFDKAESPALYYDDSPYEVPEALLEAVIIPTPSKAYSYPYGTIFLQNERVVVCNLDCDGLQNLVPEKSGKDEFSVVLQSPTNKRERENAASILRQNTVYYWVNRVLDRVEELGHSFDHRLQVYVDRDIQDPETGVALTNNAFFLSTELDFVDWSLSFLPAESSPLRPLLASGYDPSVAIHEATHFIFQEMVGDILNQEVYGLHEAFADYFAMAILNNPSIGQVMMGGTPLRTAKTLLVYESNMEVHALGNVVVSALWNIRESFSDKDLADQIVFETIKNVGNNPFAAAGEVTQAYYDALHQVGAQALQENPGLLGEIDRIWKATRLQAPALAPNLEILKTPISADESRQTVTVSIQINAPHQAVLEFGLPPVKKDTLSLITTRPGPEDSGYEWLMVALQEVDAQAPTATPFWILYSREKNIIRYAYGIDGQILTLDSERIEDYRRLIALNENLVQLLTYTQNFGADLLGLNDHRRWATFKSRRVESAQSYYKYGYPGTLLPMQVYEHDIRPTLGGYLSSFFGAAHIRATDQIRLYTIDAAALNSPRLPKNQDGDEVLIGYEILRKTGFRIGLRLEELGEIHLP